MSATYQQAVIPVADPEAFGAVRKSIASAFSTDHVSVFLKSLDRASMRIRDFEGVIAKGLLGERTATEYGSLGDGDQGQIREFYLASLEQVAPELRSRFFKLYSYY